jgi:thioredoxin-like negative regulator of GroEL
MEILIFGKQSCGKCKSTRDKFQHFIEKLGLQGSVTMTYFDTDTVDGMAEGAFCDVTEVPTTIVKVDGREVARWGGIVPDSMDIKQLLQPQQIPS